MEKTLVIIPTYNEKDNIEALLRKVFSLPLPFEVLIIDDGSPDGTADIVKTMQHEFPERLHLEQRKGKLGLGTDLNMRSGTDISLSVKWMPTFLTIPKIL